MIKASLWSVKGRWGVWGIQPRPHGSENWVICGSGSVTQLGLQSGTFTQEENEEHGRALTQNTKYKKKRGKKENQKKKKRKS